MDLLRATALFGRLDDGALRRIEAEVEQVGVPGGALVMQEGDPADCLYIVASGRLRVTVERSPGVEEAVGEVGPGESVGEMALLIGGQRSATVRAIRDSQLLRLSKAYDDAKVALPGVALATRYVRLSYIDMMLGYFVRYMDNMTN